jgi:hemoglobin-like flavoprotein
MIIIDDRPPVDRDMSAISMMTHRVTDIKITASFYNTLFGRETQMTNNFRRQKMKDEVDA